MQDYWNILETVNYIEKELNDFKLDWGCIKYQVFFSK